MSLSCEPLFVKSFKLQTFFKKSDAYMGGGGGRSLSRSASKIFHGVKNF